MVDADGRVRWRARVGDLVAFNPDGTKVLASYPGQQIAVLHGQNGSTVARVDLPAGAEKWTTVWETNRTLLTLMRHAGQAAIVRVYLDGRIERVTPPAPLNHGQSPYVLLEPSSPAPPSSRESPAEPGPSPSHSGVRVAVPSHCGVLSITINGRLWLADPPLGDHNPPPGWNENQTMGYFVETGSRQGRFFGDGGQRASFRRAAVGADDPNAGCE